MDAGSVETKGNTGSITEKFLYRISRQGWRRTYPMKKAAAELAVAAFAVGVAGLEPTTSASRTQHSTI